MAIQPLWPPLLVLTTPTGVVPFYWDGNPELVIPFDITRKSVRQSELDSLSKKLGVRVKDPAKCDPNSSGKTGSEGGGSEDLVVGERYTIRTMPGTGLSYDQAHHIRILRPLNRVGMRTNWLDRTQDQHFSGLYVEEDPEVTYVAGGRAAGQEYYELGSLQLVTIFDTLPTPTEAPNGTANPE